MVQKPLLGQTLRMARTCTLILGWRELAKPKSLEEDESTCLRCLSVLHDQVF